MIEKGVLHLDQSEFVGMRNKERRKKGKENGEEVQFLLVFQCSND